SDRFGSTPRRSAISTVSSNFAKAVRLTNSTASRRSYGRGSTSAAAAFHFLPIVVLLVLVLRDDDPHTPRRPFNDPGSRRQIGRVEIGQLDPRNLIDLGGRHLPHLVFVGHPGAFDDPGRLLEEV